MKNRVKTYFGSATDIWSGWGRIEGGECYEKLYCVTSVIFYKLCESS